jgi:hypothetical protein
MTTRAAIHFATGKAVSSSATALAQEVLRFMFVSKLRYATLTVLMVAAGVAGAGFLARAIAKPDEPEIAMAARQQPGDAKPNDATPKPASGRMFVVGRVLDPQGKPVPGATVAAASRAKLSGRASAIEGQHPVVIGHASADDSGRFRLDVPRTSSARNDEFRVIALAPGYGAGWAAIDPDALQPSAEISLQPEQVITGRLLDVQGWPAQGVVVSISAIERDSATGDPLRGRYEGPYYWWPRSNDVPAWPKPATTDSEGRFEIHGVGRRLQTQLNIIDPRFALQTIEVKTDDAPGSKSVTISVQPAKIFTGRVTYADTGKPVPKATINIAAGGAGQRGFRATRFQTDEDGRFRANPSRGDRFFVSATPPAGQRYLAASKTVDWPGGAVEQRVDFALARGVIIRGKVTEAVSKVPVAGASVLFVPHSRAGTDSNAGRGEGQTATDGSFELTVGPGAGHLAVQASNEDFVIREIGHRAFFQGEPGGVRLLSNSFVACEPNPDGASLEVEVSLRRGVTVSGDLVGPDGKAVRDTWIIGGVVLPPIAGAFRNWRGNYHCNAQTGRFELHGLDPEPDADVPVYFFQPARKLGATAQLSGKSVAGGLLTVKLEPCGTAIARLVDANSLPIARYRDESLISMIVTPGADRASRDPADQDRMRSQSEYLGRIDSVNYARQPESNELGQITFPALIPGATYRIVDRTTVRDPSGSAVRKDFTVKPGETLDLGDILIEKPQER